MFQNYSLDLSRLVCPCSAAATGTCMSAATRETESQGHSGSCRDKTRKALLLARSLPVPTSCPPSSTETFTALPNLCHLLLQSHASLPPTDATCSWELRSKDTTARLLPALRAAVPGLSQLHCVTVCDKESNTSMKRKGRQRGDNAKPFQVGRTSVSDSLLYLPANHCVIFPREDFRKARKISILHSPKATSTPLGRSSRFGLHLLSPSPLPH